VTIGGEHRSTTMRVAPASIARWIGTLSTTPPSMYRSPSISTGGKMAGMAEEARMASTAGPWVNHRSPPSVSEVATTSSGSSASSSRSWGNPSVMIFWSPELA
jgi:hypothetical protein